jgi:hypothetical protein
MKMKNPKMRNDNQKTSREIIGKYIEGLSDVLASEARSHFPLPMSVPNDADVDMFNIASSRHND